MTTPNARPSAQSGDARAVRTRRKLVAAFEESVRESDPADLTVADLTRRAGVNRTSFYEHFSSPEELAIHALGELFDIVSNADIVRRGEGSVSAVEASQLALREVVYFVHARRATYARLIGPGAPPRLATAITDAYAASATDAVRRMHSRPADVDPVLVGRYLAGGVLSVLGLWLSEPRTRWSRDRLVSALVQCLPHWVNTEAPQGQAGTDPADTESH